MPAPVYIPDSPFIVHTFIETRGAEPRRVFHPMGNPDVWTKHRNIYNARRLNLTGSPTTHRLPEPAPSEEPHQFRCCPDTFLVMADRTQLHGNGIVKPTAIWWSPPGFSCHNRIWMPIDDGDMGIHSFTNVPPDHRETDSFSIHGLIEGRTEEDIMAEVRRRYDVPEFLLQYRADCPHYEVTVHIPRADTVRYNRLRAAHLAAA